MHIPPEIINPLTLRILNNSFQSTQSYLEPLNQQPISVTLINMNRTTNNPELQRLVVLEVNVNSNLEAEELTNNSQGIRIEQHVQALLRQIEQNSNMNSRNRDEQHS